MIEKVGHREERGTEQGLHPVRAQQKQQQLVLSCQYLFVKMAGRREDLLPPLLHMRESVTVMLAMQRQGAQEGLRPAWVQQE
jgi:hypothetical protein